MSTYTHEHKRTSLGHPWNEDSSRYWLSDTFLRTAPPSSPGMLDSGCCSATSCIPLPRGLCHCLGHFRLHTCAPHFLQSLLQCHPFIRQVFPGHFTVELLHGSTFSSCLVIAFFIICCATYKLPIIHLDSLDYKSYEGRDFISLVLCSERINSI